MPELPEVETVRRVLEPQLLGLAVERVTVGRPEVIASPDAAGFCRRLAGQTVCGMQRRGKFLLILLDSGDRVALHLRMTGCLLFTPANHPAEKHTHIVFQFRNEMQLRFSDTRRFGRLWLLPEGEPDVLTGMERLGKEPFDSALSAADLMERLGKRQRAIKECLLDQSVIAGIGNIYSDEILFAARICPTRPASSLTEAEWERLAAMIPDRLSYFIQKNEITPEEYLASRGQRYRNTPFLRVYGHAGEPCPVCGEPLCRIAIGGRSSTFCPVCQKNERL